jgi:phosphoglycerate kinase
MSMMLLEQRTGRMLPLLSLQNSSHRKKMFGLVMEGEVASAEKVLHSAEKPFTAIIGGAKVSDKILIIENLLDRATDIIIGGGMAYTFFKAMGGHIGNPGGRRQASKQLKELLKSRRAKGVCIHLPSDSIIADKFAEDADVSSAIKQYHSGWLDGTGHRYHGL